MDTIDKIVYVIFGGIITLSIWSVLVSKKSQTPQVVQAFSSALSNVVAAAVNPVATAGTNGNLGLNAFTSPSH